jgi:hypothetical protein
MTAAMTMRWKRVSRERATADADRRLSEAAELHAEIAAKTEPTARLAAEAARLAKRNRIAEMVYLGLMGGGNDK